MCAIYVRFPTEQVHNARNWTPQKELVAAASVVDSTGTELVCARWYMARRGDGASPVYCSVWVRAPRHELWASGRGTAGGFGYHKMSAALDSALRSACIELRDGRGKKARCVSIGGRGDAAMRDALLAVGRAATRARNVFYIYHS